MPTLAPSRKKIITGNAVRQARYAKRMRAEGKKNLTLWVTPEKEDTLRNVLAGLRNGPPVPEGLRQSPVDHGGKTRMTLPGKEKR